MLHKEPVQYSVLYSPVCEDEAGQGEGSAEEASQEEHMLGHHQTREATPVRVLGQSVSQIYQASLLSLATSLGCLETL